MAGPIGTLAVRLAADTSKFNRDLKGATDKLEDVGRTAADINKKAAIAFAGFSAAIAGVTRAASKQISAERQLQNAFAATGNALDLERFKEFASGLQSVTTYGDEATIQMASMLARLGLTQDQLETITPSIQDMAAAMDVDLNTAAKAVGMALSGNIGALSRYQIHLTDAEKAQIKNGDAMQRTAVLAKALQDRVGGAAKVAAGTATGSFDQLKNALGDVAEDMGKVLDKPLATFIGSIKKSIEGLPAGVKIAGGAFLGLGAALSGVAIAMSTSVMMFPKIVAGFATMGTAITKVTTAVWALKAALLKVAVLAGTAAGAASVAIGTVRFAKMSDEEKVAFGKKHGITGGEGLLAGGGKMVAALAKEGLEPLKDIACDVVDSFYSLASESDQKVLPSFKGLGGQLAAATEGVTALGTAAATSAEGFDFGGGDSWGDAMDQFSAELNEATGAAYDFANQTIDLDFTELEDAVNEDIQSFTDQFGQTMMSWLGELGTTIQSIVEGAKSGGFIGAIVAVIGEILSRSEAFSRILDSVAGVLSWIGELFNPLFEALEPLVGALNNLTKLSFAMAQSISFAAPVFELLGKVMEWVGWAINKLVSGIIWVVNGILEIIAKVVGVFSKRAAEKIRDSKIDHNEFFGTAIEDQEQGKTREKMSDLGSAAGDAAEEIRDMTASLSNVPSGYKIALRQYQAIDAGSGITRPGMDGASQQSANFYGPVTIVANKPEEIVPSAKRQTAWRNVVSTGTPLNVAPAFSGA